VSELEVMNARMGAILARDEVQRFARERVIAELHLRLVLGLPPDAEQLQLGDLPGAIAPAEPVAPLMETALAARPDARAAELAVEAAGERVGLARWQFLALSGLVDANGKGDKGFEIGPGIDVGVPLFNWNQGSKARAEAELVRAMRQYATTRERIGAEIAEASARLSAATEQVALWSTRALPEMDAAVDRAEKAYAAGDVSLFLLLQTSTQQLAIRVRHLDALAEVARARADLERSVGYRLN
jgi:cobalt-zinc-cadmium efflux system outer membrane protein